MRKTFSLVLVILFLTVTLFIPSLTNAQITNSYGRGFYGEDSDLNYCSFDLTMYSPNNQTVYNNTMPLNFNITWTNYPKFLLPMPLNGYYAYSIDNGPFVMIAPTPSPSDRIVGSSEVNFLVNPSFSYSVDISNLEKGNHNIVINASLYHYNNYPPTHFYFNFTTSPYVFSVGQSVATSTTSPTSTPPATTPTITPTSIPMAPDTNSDLTTLPLDASIIIVAVVGLLAVALSALLYTRHRKTANISK